MKAVGTETNTCRSDGYNVSGFVIHVQPATLERVSESLLLIHGVDLHASDPKGKLVITVEEYPDEQTMVDSINNVNNIPGVISTTLVYTEFENDANNSLSVLDAEVQHESSTDHSSRHGP